MSASKNRKSLTLPSQKYEVVQDGYSKAQRLNLFRYDGAPLNPMYLAYKPPQMLPTQTLNPTAASGGEGAKQTGKAKRDLEIGDDFADAPLNKHTLVRRREAVDANKWWWFGVGLTGVGSMLYYCF